MDIAEAKQALRKEALARRSAIVDREALSRRIAKQFVEAIPIPKAAIVSAFIAIGEEADPASLIEALRARGNPVALPRVVGKGKPLAFHVYPAGAKLISGVFGLSQPAPDWPLAIPDVLAVPLL